MEIPKGEISCPRGIPLSLWKVLSKAYNPSQLYAIKYVSEIDNSSNSSSSSNNKNNSSSNNNNGKNVSSVLTNNNATATAATAASEGKNNSNNDNNNSKGNSALGQDTRISLIQVRTYKSTHTKRIT